MLLELQNREEGLTTKSFYTEPRARENLSILRLDSVVRHEPQASQLQKVDEPAGWTEW